jgi:hypothetical protein
MKLYNKGGRALILPKTEVISGGRLLEHDIKKDRLYLDPSANIEVNDKYGTKLLGMYPNMIMRMDTPSAKPKRRPAVKKAVAKAG